MVTREIIQRDVTQNTLSFVLDKDIKEIKGKRKKKTVDDRLHCKDGIFSSVSKFTLVALIRSHISLPDKGMFPYGGWRDLKPRRISQERDGGRINNRGTGTRSFIIGHEWKKERKSTTTTLYARRHWTSATAGSLVNLTPLPLDSNTISPLTQQAKPPCVPT